MFKKVLLYLVLFMPLLCLNNMVEAQSCTIEAQQNGEQLLSLANTYEHQKEWEKAAEVYSQATLSPCNTISDDALVSLNRTLAVQRNWYSQIQEKLFTLSLSVTIFVGVSFLVLLITKVFVWFIDRTDKWTIIPFVDLTGNISGDAIAETLTSKMHEIRLLYSSSPDTLVGLAENIDLPSFSTATQDSAFLSALSGLDSLDVSGVGLPLGSALSSMIRLLDLGGRRIFGSIQQWGNKIEIIVRLEEGRNGKCSKVWKETTEVATELTHTDISPSVENLAYRILFDITSNNWGTASASAFQSFTQSLEQLNFYYESNSRDKQALLRAKSGLVAATQIDPTYQLAILHLALVNINTGEYDESITLFKGLLRQSEFQPEIYYNLGIAYYQKTYSFAYIQAEEYFNKILNGFSGKRLVEKEKKLKALTHCGLINIAAQKTRFDNSDQELLLELGKSHYDQAIELASQYKEVYAQAQYSLALLYLNRKEYERALLLLEDSVINNPYHSRSYIALGQTCMALEEYDKAIMFLTTSTMLAPDFEYAYYQLGRAFTLSDKPNKYSLAIKAFCKAPGIASAQNDMGKIWAEQHKEYQKGLDCFKKAIELNSKSADAYANLAWYLAEGGLSNDESKLQARSAAERATDITQSNDWHKLAVLGRVYYECQDYEKARLTLEKANLLNAEAPQIHYYLALTSFAEQAYQQARQHLVSFFQLKDQNKWKDKAISLRREINLKLSIPT